MRIGEDDGRFYVEPDTSDEQARLSRLADKRACVEVIEPKPICTAGREAIDITPGEDGFEPPISRSGSL